MTMKKIQKKFIACILILITCISLIVVGNMTDFSVNAASVSIIYQAHCQDIGWQTSVSNGSIAGTTGKSLRLECLRVKVTGVGGGIRISTHQANVGWVSFTSASSGNWATSGTTGQSRAIEAVKLELYGEVANQYNITYRVHSQNIGWGNFVTNGAVAGTTGRSLRAEAIEIKLIQKSQITTPYYVKTQGSSLNVRSGPSTNYNKIGSISNGSKVDVYSISSGWAKIKYNNSIGYVSANYLVTSNISSNTVEYPLRNAKCSWSGYNNSTWSWSENRYGSGHTDERVYHLGLDLTGDSTVYACTTGTVAACSSDNSGANGRYVIVQHNINGRNCYSFYAHLSSVNVRVGQTVDNQTKLGVIGGSG